MANSPEFVSHALDLLSLVGPVQARAMFGGHGLYGRGGMFGLLDDDELFLKTDDLCRTPFESAGCRRWVYWRKEGAKGMKTRRSSAGARRSATPAKRTTGRPKKPPTRRAPRGRRR